MKKTVWLALILMLLCVFALSACDIADTPPNNGNGRQTTDENGDNNSPKNPTVCQHTFGEWDTVKQATCKEEGKRTRTCNKCSETEEESLQKSETHTPVIDAAVPATCKDTGLTEGSHCSVCNEVLVAQTVIPKTEDHTPVTDAAVTATCKNTGLTEGSHCSVCDKILVAQTVIPKTEDHTPVTDAAVTATCKNIGLTEGSHCSVCNKVLVARTVVPKTDNHTPVTDAAVAASCKNTGLTEGSHCSVCNKVLVARTVVPKTEDHTPVTDAAVPATCKDTGLTEGSHCSVCNEVLVEQVVTHKTDVHTPAKEQDGIVSCSICNIMLEDNNLYTVTFKLGSNTLKEISLKSGATITVPTPGANKWYVWNNTIPNKMPAQNITFSAIAIGGDAWAETTWEYDFNGKLSIHGKGNMSKFSEESQPWAAYKSEITSIIFDSTITGIGKYAFFGCNRLIKVVIPDSIITIGDYAFANCDSIREITIGSKVTSIGTGAFVSSYDLKCVIVRGSLNWQVKQDNYSTNITFSARDKYDNANIFKEYSAGKFTVC